MDDYADIYYVDTRNATTDHRTGGSARPSWVQSSLPTRTAYVPPAQPRPVYGGPAPVIYTGPAPLQTTAATFLGKLTTGQVVEMVAQLFAALQPLPGAPVATKDASTDIGNSIMYQSALAQHAKRDEQVRTLGGLVARLVG